MGLDRGTESIVGLFTSLLDSGKIRFFLVERIDAIKNNIGYAIFRRRLLIDSGEEIDDLSHTMFSLY